MIIWYSIINWIVLLNMSIQNLVLPAGLKNKLVMLQWVCAMISMVSLVSNVANLVGSVRKPNRMISMVCQG